MKSKIIFTATAVLLLCVGMGMFLYASANDSTTITAFSTEEVADNTETVSSPPERACTAYAYRCRNNNTDEQWYFVTTYEINVGDAPHGYTYIFEESMEGEIMDCVECPVQCTAFYDLCLKYNVDYEY